jgi:hypothetical protein
MCTCYLNLANLLSCWPNQRADVQKGRRSTVTIKTCLCRFTCNCWRCMGKCRRLNLASSETEKWKHQNFLSSSYGCDDVLPAVRTFTEKWFWLVTCVISDQIKWRYGCLSFSSLSTYSLSETETLARQRKQVSDSSVWQSTRLLRLESQTFWS